MNTANPFQIPECFQKADLQQRRRERFKKGVIAVVFAIMALLVVLLIQGCMSERAGGSTQNVVFTPSAATPVNNTVVDHESSASSVPITPTQNVASAGQKSTPVTRPADLIYVVKSGDSLTRIAKIHGTTIKAIKNANDLASDRIVVGAKLKIPQA